MSEATAEQRIFSLILALLTTGDRGSSKHVLLSTVYGYAEQYEWGASNASLERKFERDKEQLRDIGIPVETFYPYDSSGNNHEIHYRIRKDELQIPAHLTFTDQELRMLNVAALMWEEGSLSVESRRALMKLGSLSDGVTSAPVPVGKVLTIPEPWVADIREAMARGRVVTFGYRKAGKRKEQRRVAPLRLHRADGRWHLIGYDYRRADYRSFLLSRMTGGVHIEDELFDDALLAGVPAVVERLQERQSHQVAVVRVEPGSRADHALSWRGTRDADTLKIHTLDMAALAEELLSYGSHVDVVSPDALRVHVRRVAADIARLHGAKGVSA